MAHCNCHPGSEARCKSYGLVSCGNRSCARAEHLPESTVRACARHIDENRLTPEEEEIRHRTGCTVEQALAARKLKSKSEPPYSRDDLEKQNPEWFKNHDEDGLVRHRIQGKF